jgi:Xaa-Pro aminopeptidase
MFDVEGTSLRNLKEAMQGTGRLVRKVREWCSGEDLHEAQMHRSDDYEFRVNPGGGLGF